MYTVTINSEGQASLQDDEGNSLWSSDQDEEFLEEFGDCLDDDDIDGLLIYLDEFGELPKDEDVQVISRYADGTEEVQHYTVDDIGALE
jgi:hypothetical protein